jgi:hypothetical protein
MEKLNDGCDFSLGFFLDSYNINAEKLHIFMNSTDIVMACRILTSMLTNYKSHLFTIANINSFY